MHKKLTSVFKRLVMLCAIATPVMAAEPEYVLNFSNVMAPSHDSSLGIERFAELVHERSEGRIKVRHYPGGQLGSDTETFAAAQQGMMHIAGGSSANVVNITRAFEVLHLPYIFDDRAHSHRVLDSERFQALINEQLAKNGLVWLLTFEYGFRNVFTVKNPVMEPADVAGLKLRASRSPLEIKAIEAFGGTAVTVDWPEVYTGLRFGIVDGHGQPYGTTISARHHEVLRYSLENGFQYYAFLGLASRKQWERLPDWAQKILIESARDAEQYHRKIWAEKDASGREAFIAAGGTVNTPTPQALARWKEAGRSTWKNSGVSQALIQTVRDQSLQRPAIVANSTDSE